MAVNSGLVQVYFLQGLRCSSYIIKFLLCNFRGIALYGDFNSSSLLQPGRYLLQKSCYIN